MYFSTCAILGSAKTVEGVFKLVEKMVSKRTIKKRKYSK